MLWIMFLKKLMKTIANNVVKVSFRKTLEKLSIISYNIIILGSSEEKKSSSW